MGRISFFYISIVLILTYFFLYMTVKYPNYYNQFDNDRFEKIYDSALMKYGLERNNDKIRAES